ncbi:MAG: beta-galactosidase [Eubacterium sp.]|nr:beta-galactosidase [Eubacterium sp.]
MRTIDLSGAWRLKLEKEADAAALPPKSYPDTIRLPDTLSHARKAPRNADRAAGYLTDRYSYEGYAWFAREFTLAGEDAALDAFLTLERTRMTVVYLDGVRVGEGDSLATPHRFALPALTAGVHTLAIRVANVGYPTGGGHLTSPDTQTNWLGITGAIRLELRPRVRAEGIAIFPDAEKNLLRLRLTATGAGTLSVFVRGYAVRSFAVTEGENEPIYDPGAPLPLWDEFSPNVLSLTVRMNGEEQSIPFGLRKLETRGLKLYINGNETFLRGKHDGMVFPLTGYAPTDPAEWERVFAIAKEYGINHYRFHTCCPPEAAFIAADRLGIYLEPELPFWGTIPDEPNDEQRYLVAEGFRMIAEYGNHPSFVMLSLGNELWGNKDAMNTILRDYRALDPRRLYSDGSNNFQFYPDTLAEADFLSGVRLSRERLYRGSYAMCDAPLGHIQTDRPNSVHNYDGIIRPAKTEESASGGGKILIQYGTGVKEVEADGSAGLVPDVPVISHEIGQYETYPDYRELSHYTGSIRAENIALYKEKAEARGLLPLADRFFRASGALAVQCYKAELETALRSENLSGFQLLDLQDFPGQGTALVGVLNSLMESKGLISAEDWRCFCDKTAVLAEFQKFVFDAGEKVSFGIALFNTDPAFNAETVAWAVEAAGERVADGVVPIVGEGRVRRLGEITPTLPEIGKPVKYTLRLTVEGTEYYNTYRFIAYPPLKVEIDRGGIATEDGRVSFAFDLEKAIAAQKRGERVVYVPSAEGKLEGAYCTDFWCYPMFRSISESMDRPLPTGTMGCLIDPNDPALAEFPTETHTTPEWYEIVTHSHSEELTEKDRAIVRVIDNPDRAKDYALLYEKDTEAGKLLACTARLWEAADDPAARRLAYSLARYLIRS